MPLPDEGVEPGTVLARYQNATWLAYEHGGDLVAACYVGGRLLRRDHRGWWYAGSGGERGDWAGDVTGHLRGSHPYGWPVHPEHAELVSDDDD